MLKLRRQFFLANLDSVYKTSPNICKISLVLNSNILRKFVALTLQEFPVEIHKTFVEDVPKARSHLSSNRETEQANLCPHVYRSIVLEKTDPNKPELIDRIWSGSPSFWNVKKFSFSSSSINLPRRSDFLDTENAFP